MSRVRLFLRDGNRAKYCGNGHRHLHYSSRWGPRLPISYEPFSLRFFSLSVSFLPPHSCIDAFFYFLSLSLSLSLSLFLTLSPCYTDECTILFRLSLSLLALFVESRQAHHSFHVPESGGLSYLRDYWLRSSTLLLSFLSLFLTVSISLIHSASTIYTAASELPFIFPLHSCFRAKPLYFFVFSSLLVCRPFSILFPIKLSTFIFYLIFFSLLLFHSAHKQTVYGTWRVTCVIKI